MNDTNNQIRPSVPGGMIPLPGSGNGQRRLAEGAKNPRVKAGCHTRIHIAAYNARTLSSNEKMLEMETELEKIKWDVVGVSEVRKPGEEFLKLNSGHAFFYRGSDSQTRIHGVGLFIHRRWTSHITHKETISDRVLYVCLKINSKYSVKVIQAYAPTSTHDDEMFYEDVAKAMSNNRSHYQYIVGDFNAKLGKREEEAETSIGNFSFDRRNERGDTLLNFLQQHDLFAMNSFFTGKMQRKWTWASADGVTKNEIDYIITNRKPTVKDITVLNRFTTGSDHRLVRAKVVLNTRFERSKMVKKHEKVDVQRLYEQSEDFATKMSAKLKDVVDQNETLDQLNSEIVKSIAGFMESNCKSTHVKESKLSKQTLDLIASRVELIKNGKRDSAEYRDITKSINKAMRSDLRKYNVELAQRTIEANCNMKVLRSKLTTAKKQIFKLRDKNGTIQTDQNAILNIAKEFYEDLFSSKRQRPTNATEETQRNRPVITNVGSEELPEVTVEEVKAAITEMKNGKSPGEDGVPVEAIKLGGDTLLGAVCELFNKCLEIGETPRDWENAVIILLHKKGDITKLENYRPISLLSTLYKLFMKIIAKRNTNKLDFYQPVEQAGFRSGFSTNDHLQVMRSLIEKCREYGMEMILIFIDFEKAFDSVETWSILDSLDECRVDSRYSSTIRYIYENATSCIRLHENTEKLKVGRGVRQGDTISPKLFTSTLESVFKKLDWSEMGINVNGKYLSHLRKF